MKGDSQCDVLIVEDDAMQCIEMQGFLSRAGLNVETARDATSGLARAIGRDAEAQTAVTYRSAEEKSLKEDLDRYTAERDAPARLAAPMSGTVSSIAPVATTV